MRNVLALFAEGVNHLLAGDDPGEPYFGDGGISALAVSEPYRFLSTAIHQVLEVLEELLVERRRLYVK
jgi:hypothetical protein